MDTIIYHNACPDGFTAAYIAKKKYPEAQLVPRDHGTPINVESFRDKDVLTVDCNLRGSNDEVAAVAKTYQVYDHHKSETEIIGKPYAVYDIARSGAGLTWDYLFGKDSKLSDGEQLYPHPDFVHEQSYYRMARPWWVNYVEDRDLWRFRLPHSEEINAYIMTFPHTIEGWDTMTQVPIEQAIEAGKAVLLQVNHYVREAVKQAQYSTWEIADNTYSTAVVNLPYLNCSEVGAVLAKAVDVSATWFERHDGIVQFSLRSAGDIDVSKIAQIFGGGGHKNAAGFQIPLAQGRAVVDTILKRNLVRIITPFELA